MQQSQAQRVQLYSVMTQTWDGLVDRWVCLDDLAFLLGGCPASFASAALLRGVALGPGSAASAPKGGHSGAEMAEPLPDVVVGCSEEDSGQPFGWSVPPRLSSLCDRVAILQDE